MRKKSLVILNIGLILIMLSALGEGMQIDYLILIAGITFSSIGAMMLFRTKNKELEGKER